MSSGIEEVIGALYEMVQDAWSLPLGADKCVLERDKVLDLLDEINNQLPAEFKQAKTIVDARNEVITNAKREAEGIRNQAEERARALVDGQEIVRIARARSSEMLAEAESRSSEMLTTAETKAQQLRRASSEFCEDMLRRTEETISAALGNVQQTRAGVRAAMGAAAPQPQPQQPKITFEEAPEEEPQEV